MGEFTEKLAELGRLYERLSAQVELERKPGGRRMPATSRPPLNLGAVDCMKELENLADRGRISALWLLEPWQRIELTARTRARCPYCDGELRAWLHQKTEQSVIQCISDEPHQEGEQKQWHEAEWRRLGVLVGSEHIPSFDRGVNKAWENLEQAIGENPG